MSHRLDVRRMLLKRGWTEDHDGVLHKYGAIWAPVNQAGDSGIDAAGAAYGLGFNADVPARVITAVAELVANDGRPSGDR